MIKIHALWRKSTATILARQILNLVDEVLSRDPVFDSPLLSRSACFSLFPVKAILTVNAPSASIAFWYRSAVSAGIDHLAATRTCTEILCLEDKVLTFSVITATIIAKVRIELTSPAELGRSATGAFPRDNLESVNLRGNCTDWIRLFTQPSQVLLWNYVRVILVRRPGAGVNRA